MKRTLLTAIGVALVFGAIPARAQDWHGGGGHHHGGGGWHGYGGYHHHPHHPGGFYPGHGGYHHRYYYPPRLDVFVPVAGPRYLVPAEFVGTPVGSMINYGGYNHLIIEDGSVVILQ